MNDTQNKEHDRLAAYLSKYVKGDDESLGNIYKILLAKLLLFGKGFSRDDYFVQDCVNEVFANLLTLDKARRKKYFDKEYKSVFFLFAAMVRRKMAEEARKSNNRDLLLEARKEEFILPNQPAEIEGILFAEDFKRMQHLLSERERTVLRYSLAGFSVANTAKLEKLSPKQVSSSIYKAKMKLKEAWSDWFIVALLILN